MKVIIALDFPNDASLNFLRILDLPMPPFVGMKLVNLNVPQMTVKEVEYVEKSNFVLVFYKMTDDSYEKFSREDRMKSVNDLARQLQKDPNWKQSGNFFEKDNFEEDLYSVAHQLAMSPAFLK